MAYKMIFALAVLLAGGCSSADNGQIDDKKEIAARERGLADCQTSTCMSQFYAPDMILYDWVVPGVFRGKAAVIADLDRLLVGMKSAKIDFKEITVDSHGPLGYAYSVQHAVIVVQDGSTNEVTFRQTDIWKKIDGKWNIIHQQASYPADPKTARTVFNAPN